MEILTAAEMAATDRRTADEFGVPVAELMENAGTAVARFCLREYAAAERVVVLCGKGNNGGDGMVAARVLADDGVSVAAVLLGRSDEVKGEAALALRRLQAVEGVRVREAADEGQLDDVRREIEAAELIVDAVLGTGFKPVGGAGSRLRGMVETVRGIVERSEAPVVAVDLPSGWDADSAEQYVEGAFRADAVVTFTRPKMAHVFGHLTREIFGPVVVAGIGSPDEAARSESGLTWAGAAKAIAERPRDVNSNKGLYGHVLVVGGSYGMAGAPSMASLAALRTGAGLVTAAVPQCVADTVALIAPELMMRPLWQSSGHRRQEHYGVPSEANLGPEHLTELLKGITAIAVGPGLSRRPGAGEFAREFIAKVKLPMVVDADGLNAFDGRAAELNGDGRVMVLTPHPGEMARLAGMTVKEVEGDRIGVARRFATEHKLTLVLKGWRTLVAHPDGRIAVNTSGNPAMAKGGSGDILTGIVAAMLAQYAASGEAEDVVRAVEAAVYLHGLAGDFAALDMDEHTVLATDTVTHLSDAFRYRTRDADGMNWICGVNA